MVDISQQATPTSQAILAQLGITEKTVDQLIDEQYYALDAMGDEQSKAWYPIPRSLRRYSAQEIARSVEQLFGGAQDCVHVSASVKRCWIFFWRRRVDVTFYVKLR